MADREKILTQHPLLYHMTEAGAWGKHPATWLAQYDGVANTVRRERATAIRHRVLVPQETRSHLSQRLRLCGYPRPDSNASGQIGPRSDRHGPFGMVQAVERKGIFLVDRKSAEIIFEGQITPGPASRRTHCLHSFAGRTACNRNNAISHQLRNRSRAHAQTGFEHLPNDSRSQL